MEKAEQILQLLHDARGMLAYQESCGLVECPKTAELTHFLQHCKWQQPAPSVPIQKKQVSRLPEQRLVKQDAPSVPKSDLQNLGEIAREIAVCSNCGLSAKRSCAVPGIGGGDQIRLMVIGHWLPGPEDSSAVFGDEEDLMLKRMLAAIHLPLEDVFITNVIKCGVGTDVQPQAEHIDACASYLHRQITAASPELICTMGMIATKALLRLPQPLSRLRGRFYPYSVPEGTEIPLLPTYHPGYLLQNPEMKKATWHDLQALEKRLLSTNQ